MNISIIGAMAILQILLDSLKEQNKDPAKDMAESALNMALEAMGKQVETKAIEHDGMFIVCPSCKSKVLPSKYCSKCGQALMEVKV